MVTTEVGEMNQLVQSDSTMDDNTPRSGRCALVGKSNVGKSTLLNTLLGQKLAIATAKPQTTRTCILGVYLSSTPPTQIAFVDTPGLHRPRNALGRALIENAKGGLVDADVVVLVCEVGKSVNPHDFLSGEDQTVMELLNRETQPLILAINKVDRLQDKGQLLPLIDHLNQLNRFCAIIPLSALKGDNVQALLSEIRNHLAQGLQYDQEQLTDRPERFFVAELVREAVIQQTHQEIPYSIAVVVEQFSEEPNITRIAATIVVAKEAHKGIVIGKGGRQLKSIGTSARKEIEAFLGRKVFIRLWVKVIEGWTDNPQNVKNLSDHT